VIRMVGMVFPKAPLLLGQSGLSQSCQENVFEPVVKDRSIPIRVLFDANDAAIVIVRRQSQGFSKLSCGAVRVVLEPISGGEQPVRGNEPRIAAAGSFEPDDRFVDARLNRSTVPIRWN
jgi:hypothetical protein